MNTTEHEHDYKMKRCRTCGASQPMPEVDDDADFAETQAFIQRLKDNNSPAVSA